MRRSLDELYQDEHRRRRWERYGDPQDEPPDLPDDEPPDVCGVCGLPMDDHWLASCPETADPACNPVAWDDLFRSGDPVDGLDPVLDTDDRALDARREDTP